MIITIARECGCDGDTVGKRLAELYGIPLYDKRAIIQLAKETGVYDRMPNFFREKPINSLLYAIAAGGGEIDLFQTPIRALQAVLGDQSCVLIGRCGNYAFRDREDAYRIFLFAEHEKRVDRIERTHQTKRARAEKVVDDTDDKRREFQKFYTGEDWGEAENYDLSLDVGAVGVEGTVRIIRTFIEEKQHFAQR
ncbi:MAG: cytidylate kinase-like family protein [Eubacteriales bacterium]|nr:cytidylate kinase-like family protein [Eubacteriales bacterium]